MSYRGRSSNSISISGVRAITNNLINRLHEKKTNVPGKNQQKGAYVLLTAAARPDARYDQTSERVR